MRVEVTRTVKRIVKMRLDNDVLKVVANCFLSEKKLRQIIMQNVDWINAQKKVSAAAVAIPLKCEKDEPNAHEEPDWQSIVHGRKTVVSGRLTNVLAGTCSKPYAEDGVLYIPEKSYQNKQSRLFAIGSYLKRVASVQVAEEAADFGSKVALCPLKIAFGDIKEYWVNCSAASKRVLRFDFRIAQLPQNLRNYVIVHGFAHMVYPIHDGEFWNYVEKYAPDFRECSSALKEYNILKNLSYKD